MNQLIKGTSAQGMNKIVENMKLFYFQLRIYWLKRGFLLKQNLVKL